MITLQGKPVNTGCYVDGYVGHYLSAETLRLATVALPGHPEAPTWRRMANRYEFGEDADTSEACFEMADEAVDALNDATEGGVWMFEDGELFLRSDDELVDER